MAQDGDTITYTFSGSKVTEDISSIQEITIDRMDGADGQQDTRVERGNNGSGGLIENATADVTDYDTLDIWVGEKHTGDSGDVNPFGRSNGGNAESSAGGGAGGGSTEIWTDSNSVFIAAADAGGGAGSYEFLPEYNTSVKRAGGGGARGGQGGQTNVGSTAGGGGGSGFGGDGGDYGDSSSDPAMVAGDGGQELGIASGGSQTTGGSSAGNGEITISYTQTLSPPDPPSNLSAEVQ